MSIHPDYFATFQELLAGGTPFAAVTLVDVVGSAPADAGARMLVGREGLLCGTVGGGRVEARAVAEAQAMLANPGSAPTTFVEWNLQRDVGMTCGGVVRFFFEVHHQRPWHVALFGAGHVAQALVRLLLTLPCRVAVYDPRPDWLARLPVESRLHAVLSPSMEARVAEVPDDASVLCITMGHRTDRPILEEIFRSRRRFPFVGVIGSKAKRAVLQRELLDAGIAEDQIARMHCPVGLPLGSNHPGEIAVSIAAQLLQVRDAVQLPR